MNQKLSRDDVLNDFSIEFDYSKETLLKFVREFPEYANDLVDLSIELFREVDESRPLTLENKVSIQSAMDRFRNELALQQEPVNIAPQLFLNATT